MNEIDIECQRISINIEYKEFEFIRYLEKLDVTNSQYHKFDLSFKSLSGFF